ncbi:MAG TPA: hypothetical protein VHB77_21260, partial [Planctomycetaceae bacterium]|nr:hypothetical protein [Planctomycetaceae bacterium]
GRKVAEYTGQQCAETQPVLTQLEHLDLYDVRALPALAADREPFAQVATAWTPLRKTGEAWTELSQIYRHKPAPTAESEALQAYLKSPAFSGLASGGELADALQARIDVVQEANRSTASLAQAEKLFASRSYADCLKQLDSIKVEALSASDQSALETLRRRAQFRRHWARHESQGAASPKARDELRKLLDDSPEPVTDEDRALVERKRGDLQEIDAKVRLAELFGKSHLTLEDLLDGSEQLLADHPDTAEELQRKFREWLLKQFPKRQRLSVDPLLQETWTKEGRYKQGIFRVGSQSGAASVWFKYWETPAEFRANKAAAHQIYRSQLESDPEILTEVRLLDEYEAGRAALLKRVSSQSAWDTFAQLCANLQEQADKYYARRGPDVEPAIGFRNAGETAARVRDRWDIAGRLLK